MVKYYVIHLEQIISIIYESFNIAQFPLQKKISSLAGGKKLLCFCEE